MKIKVNIQSYISYVVIYNNISLAFGFVLYFGRLLCWSGGVAFRLPCIYLENFNMEKILHYRFQVLMTYCLN